MSLLFDAHRAITKAILETIGTDFLLLDGSRAMTGDLDMGNNDVDFGTGTFYTPNLAFYQISSNSFQIANRAKTLAKNLTLGTLYCLAHGFTTSTGAFNARNAANAYFILRAPDTGVGLIECARCAGGAEPDFNICRAGDIVALAGKLFDAYTNAGYMKPRRLSQSAEPTPQTGEILIWRDTDDDKTYIVYEDPDLGGRKIALT